MKLRRVEISETVSRLLYRRRLAEIAWESFPVVSLILTSIWHMSGDVHQSGYRWIRPSFGNDGSSIAMRDKNALPILLSKDAFRGSHSFFKRCLLLLDDAHVE